MHSMYNLAKLEFIISAWSPYESDLLGGPTIAPSIVPPVVDWQGSTRTVRTTWPKQSTYNIHSACIPRQALGRRRKRKACSIG